MSYNMNGKKLIFFRKKINKRLAAAWQKTESSATPPPWGSNTHTNSMQLTSQPLTSLEN